MAETKTALDVKELGYRQADRLEVTLWWIRGTLDTYVHVVDHREQPPAHHYIDVKPPASPNDVFLHPFAYLADNPTIEFEAIDGRGSE